MFIGWEGVGLVSYLLISFWFTRLNANQSAIKAILVNKIGDIGLWIAIKKFKRKYSKQIWLINYL